MKRTPCWLAALFVGAGCSSFQQDTDFTIELNTLPFANFGGSADALLDSVAVQQLFGPAACEPGTDCLLVPEAEYWSLQLNSAMAGGRCEGFSAFSQALFAGLDDAADYGGSSAADLTLDDVGSRLAYWQATGSLGGVVDNTERLSALQTLRRLQELLRQEGPVARLGLSRLGAAGPLGGHALTPYGISAGADGGWDVWVSDPNHPGEDRAIHADAEADSWSYESDGTAYAGNLNDGNGLWLTPLQARVTPGQCLLCEGSAAAGATVLLHGPATARVSDCADAELGSTDAGFLYEGSLGAVRPTFSGLAADGGGLAFFVGDSEALCVDATSRAPGAEEADRLALGLWRTERRMAWVGGRAGVGGHHLTSSASGLELDYVTDVTNGGPLVLSGEADDNSRLLVRVETDAAPQTLGIRLLPADGDAIVDLGAGVDQALHIHLTRSRGLRRDAFDALLDPQPAGADLRLLAGSWAGDGSPLTIEVDDDGDGAADRTLSVPDCQDPAACRPPSGDDGDAVPAELDNCPDLFNPGQDDRDGDGAGDSCDACPDDPDCVCPAGTWEDGGDLLTPCAPCSAGEHCPGGAEPPEPCGGATFDHDLDPATACRPCDDGYSSPDGLTCG